MSWWRKITGTLWKSARLLIWKMIHFYDYNAVQKLFGKNHPFFPNQYCVAVVLWAAGSSWLSINLVGGGPVFSKVVLLVIVCVERNLVLSKKSDNYCSSTRNCKRNLLQIKQNNIIHSGQKIRQKLKLFLRTLETETVFKTSY